jgi:putative transposase
MARWVRIVIPDCPHHIILRGNHRESVFFCDSDRLLYLRLIRIFGDKNRIKYVAYCLMTNHTHFVALPKSPMSFARGLGEAHRKYTNLINTRENLSGHLWQGRYRSYPLDESHLFSTIRYIERNPVRAGIVSAPEDYVWSSARAHMMGRPDPLISPLGQLPGHVEWSAFVHALDGESDVKRIQAQEQTGRPLGGEEFIKRLETLTGRALRYKKKGRKKGN